MNNLVTYLSKVQNLFILSLIAIITVYIIVFGENKTIEMIQEKYLFILALVAVYATMLFFKFKTKDYEIKNFNQNNTFSIKNTIVFFLIFQVIDYIAEDGFIGMISQWFLYWIMGLIAFVLMETINYYKNYKLIFAN